MERNVFIYWVGREYALISILRGLINLHSKHGKGYTVHLITEKNLGDYVKNIPECFSRLCPAHQADFVRCVCSTSGCLAAPQVPWDIHINENG
jgi:hypothetical protein